MSISAEVQSCTSVLVKEIVAGGELKARAIAEEASGAGDGSGGLEIGLSEKPAAVASALVGSDANFGGTGKGFCVSCIEPSGDPKREVSIIAD